MKNGKTITFVFTHLLLRSLSGRAFTFPITTRSHVCTLSAEATAAEATANKPPTAASAKVVIVGGGIGGLSTAFDARHLLPHSTKVVVVSDSEKFSFTPSNPWVAVGTRSPSEIQLELADILPRHNIEFVHQAAISLDPKQKRLTLTNGETLDYDYLVAATGPRLAFEEVPGLREYGQSICTTPHAVQACHALDELAQYPGPVVVGATQGASCFGPAYEYALLLQHTLHQRGGRVLVDKCPIHFVTPEPYIGHLGLNGAGDSKEIMTNLLRDKKVHVMSNCRVVKVNKESVTVKPIKTGTFDEIEIKSKLTMLIPPFHGHRIWQDVPELTDRNGMILVNEYQQSLNYPSIFAVGVAVHMDPPKPVKDTENIPIGVPKTGYMIESMGTAAIKNIGTLMGQCMHTNSDSGEPPDTLRTKPKLNGLCLTDFGDSGAIFVTMPQIPPRRYDWTVQGRIGTLAKIAFEKYFLHKIESGDTDPYYEKYMLMLVGIERITEE